MTSENALAVPVAAVKSDNGKSYVFVIRDDTASKREVMTGLRNDQMIQIVSGLDAGENVAVNNTNNLFDNMSVAIESQ